MAELEHVKAESDKCGSGRDLADEALAGPLSPAALGPAVADLAEHMAPAYAQEMTRAAGMQFLRAFATDQWPVSDAEDHRFKDPAWHLPPFNLFARNFLLAEQWLDACILKTPGVEPEHARLAAFAARQWLDAFSPSNLPWTNPEVLRRTLEEGGMNLAKGFGNLLEDLRRQADGNKPHGPAPFVVGRDLATTPGKVVLRNELMELIQYSPATEQVRPGQEQVRPGQEHVRPGQEQVRPEPLLIVPAWIMKYYILDLAPGRSLIAYLVGRGYTVFCISWRNPGAEMAETSFDDYRRLGPMAALGAIESITGAKKIHALGYCLGGTLLAVTAAAMARDGDDRLASLGLLAAQTDFSEPGELQIFIDATQLDQLDKIMAQQGYLDSTQMAGAFSMLHARDLIWSRMVKSYLLGEVEHPNDLMAWNADATRMPYRMHSQYLRAMFLQNDLAAGRFEAAGAPVSLATISAPIFTVGTEADHVAPWRSVYKILNLNAGDISFLLASGGHNGGIVSEPGRKHRSFRLAHREKAGKTPATGEYLSTAALYQGSWWLAYADWLDAHSSPGKAPPAMGASLGDAPGSYVLEP